MELDQIEAFERVVREGNFTRAAEALNLTQPAISTRIALLETELGGAVFERSGRQLQLTPLGQRFLPYAERILAMITDSQQAIEAFQSGRTGEIKVAAPTPFLLGLLVDVLVEFRRLNPSVDVLLRERDKRTILDMLHDNTITLGVVNEPVFDGGMRHLARFEDPIRAVVAPRHPLSARSEEGLQVAEICQHTILRVSLFPRMTAFMDELAEYARTTNNAGGMLTMPMVMALKMATLGQGVTFLPESYVQPTVQEGLLCYLRIEDMPTLKSNPVIVALKNRKLDSAHEEFIRVMKKRWKHLLV